MRAGSYPAIALAIALASCAHHPSPEAERGASASKPIDDPDAQMKRVPFGPVHEPTGDPYALSDAPQYETGTLRIPIHWASQCGDPAFHLEVDAVSPSEPHDVVATLVQTSEGRSCETDKTVVLEYDMAKELPPGCYQTLLLRMDGQDGADPIALDMLGCPVPETADAGKKKHGKQASPVVSMDEEHERWGDAYQVVGSPTLDHGVVHVTTRHPGGCKVDTWDVHVTKYGRGKVATMSADLVHDAHGDDCKGLETNDLALDVTPWLQKDCPDMMALHVPDKLPTGDLFDREVLLQVDRNDDCKLGKSTTTTARAHPATDDAEASTKKAADQVAPAGAEDAGGSAAADKR